MAHFAKIGINSTVMYVTTLDNNKMLNANNVEDENVGKQYLENHSGWPADLWVQCSYNTRNGIHYTKQSDTSYIPSSDQSKAFRGNYPAKGDIWDAENNIFYKPRPYASWTLNKTTATWESPIQYPAIIIENDIRIEFYWNEVNTRWQKNDNTKYWNTSTSNWVNI
jgi:hypothetical protein